MRKESQSWGEPPILPPLVRTSVGTCTGTILQHEEESMLDLGRLPRAIWTDTSEVCSWYSRVKQTPTRRVTADQSLLCGDQNWLPLSLRIEDSIHARSLQCNDSDYTLECLLPVIPMMAAKRPFAPRATCRGMADTGQPSMVREVCI